MSCNLDKIFFYAVSILHNRRVSWLSNLLYCWGGSPIQFFVLPLWLILAPTCWFISFPGPGKGIISILSTFSFPLWQPCTCPWLQHSFFPLNRYPNSESTMRVPSLWPKKHLFFGFLPRTEFSCGSFQASWVSCLHPFSKHTQPLFSAPIHLHTISLLAWFNFYSLMSLFQVPLWNHSVLSCSLGQGMA